MSIDLLAAILVSPFAITLYVVFGFFLLFFSLRLLQRKRAVEKIRNLPVRPLPNPTEQDEEAYAFIAEERIKLWEAWEKKRDFSLQAFYDVAFAIVKPVAAIYFPREDQPHMKARVKDLVSLNTRVYNRVEELLDNPLLGRLKRMDIESIQKIRSGFRIVMENPIAQVVRNRDLRRHWSNLIAAINMLNPWFWFRRGITELSLEMAYRYFFISFVTIVGEEATLIYGRPDVDEPSLVIDRITARSAIAILSEEEVIHPDRLKAFYAWLLHETSLDSEERLAFLAQLNARKPSEPSAGEIALLKTLDGEKSYAQAIKTLVEIAPLGNMASQCARRLQVPVDSAEQRGQVQ